jgi:hypothetical protein
VLTTAVTFRYTPRGAQVKFRGEMQSRLKTAANFLRRTVRAMVGQKPPTVKLGVGSYIYLAPSVVGDPPYRRKGTLQSHIGYDWKTGQVMEAGVFVESYGMERGKGKFSGRARPHLQPAYKLNFRTLQDIVLGRASAPDHGDIGKANNRKSVEVKIGKKPQRYQGEAFDHAKALAKAGSYGYGSSYSKAKEVHGMLGGRAIHSKKWADPEFRRQYARRAALIRWAGHAKKSK